MSEIDELAGFASPTLFNAINKYLSGHTDRDRHDDGVAVAEAISAALASISLSWYRSLSTGPGNEGVERLLTDSGRKPTMSFGDFSQLIQKAAPSCEPFGDLADIKLAGVSTLRNASTVLEKIGRVDSVRATLEDALRGRSSSPLGLVESIRVFERYRNKAIGHARASEWPVDARDYYEVMLQIVEPALHGLAGAVAPLLEQFSVAELSAVVDTGDHFEHQLRVERGGRSRAIRIDLTESALRVWREPEWRAQKGGLVLLGPSDVLIGPYVDLLTSKPPPPLPVEDDDLVGEATDRDGEEPIDVTVLAPEAGERPEAASQVTDEVPGSSLEEQVREAVTERGLMFRPDPKSPGAKITAPRSTAYLLYVHPLDGSGPVQVTVGHRVWADHFPMTPTEVRDLLGDSVRVPPESAVNEICSIVDRALAAVRDVEARFGDEAPLDGWLRTGSPSMSELLRRTRAWAAANGYYERATVSAVCWGPTARRSVVFLYPADLSVTLDLDYAQRHGKRTEAKRLLESIRSEWAAPLASYRWQPLAGADVLARWADFTDLVLDPLAQIEAAEPGVAEIEG